MSDYGLPDLRDKDGELQEAEHTYQWDGQEITIKLIPPTISEYDEYVSLGEDADESELRRIVDDHLVKPDIPEDEDLTMRELLCYTQGIVAYCRGSSGIAAEIRDELEERQDEAQGN
jgi:hypothetical protein